MYATARDWARFGQLYLQEGRWAGDQILPENWVKFSTTPVPVAPAGKYGAHWWLNRGVNESKSTRPYPSLPEDLFRASGYEGQELIVVPSWEMVIVRLGMTPDRNNFNLPKLIHPILEFIHRS